MPELPEIETIKRGLSPVLENAKIKQITVLEPKSFIGTPEDFIGTRLASIDRRGKALLLRFNNNQTLMIHLRMTGQLIFRAKNQNIAGGHPSDSWVETLPNKQTRVVIDFEDNSQLFFNDQRKFGFIKAIYAACENADSFLGKLGPDALSASVGKFDKNLKKHQNALIKATILDQSVIAGVGNIYADESLFFARIHPARRTKTLSHDEITNLLEGIKASMQASLDSGGSTLKNYVKSDGTRGDYLTLFAQVFNRQGQPCPRCAAPIEKIRVAGRGTHICPECQRLQP